MFCSRIARYGAARCGAAILSMSVSYGAVVSARLEKPVCRRFAILRPTVQKKVQVGLKKRLVRGIAPYKKRYGSG